MASKLYVVRGGKRRYVGRSHQTARARANSLRVGVGSGDRGAFRYPTAAEARKWKPKKGRKKLGARRKLTFLETLTRWIRVTTVRKSRSRRR